MRLRLVSAAVVGNALLAAAAYSGCAGGGSGVTTGTGGGVGGSTSPASSTTGSGGGTTTSTTASSTGPGTGGTGGKGTGGAGGLGGAGGAGGGADAGSNGCTHDVCAAGAPLDASCNACTTAVCANDSYCCDPQGMWDSSCTGIDVTMYCPGMACAMDGGADGGGNGCTHDVCAAGAPLDPGCDACTAAVCAKDAFCCDSAESWDSTCVGTDVPMYCPGVSCAMDGGADGGGMDGGGCPLDHVVISEIRSRGAAGAGDEFIELFNPTPDDVVLDNTWKIDGRSVGAAAYSVRWKGAGGTIPAHGHFLITGSTYAQMPAKDQSLSSGIKDAASLVLSRGAAVIDAVCYGYNDATLGAFAADATYTCEGMPVSNAPHNNGNAGMSDSDVSIERKPGGAAGNCTDTDDNASDFMSSAPATPLDSASPPTP